MMMAIYLVFFSMATGNHLVQILVLQLQRSTVATPPPCGSKCHPHG